MTEAVIIQKRFCEANQWSGFYMITAAIMKELSVILRSLLFIKISSLDPLVLLWSNTIIFFSACFSLTDTDELWDNTWPVRTAHKHPETWLVIYTWDVSVLFLYAVYVNEPDCYWKRLIHLQELPLHCSYILFLVLTHFIPVFLLHNPWKNQKTRGFLFSGGIKKEYRPEIS